MANRALAAKVERARRQAGELAAREYSKPFYTGNLTIGAAEAQRAETARLIAGFKGQVKTYPLAGRCYAKARSGVPMGDAAPGRALLLPGVPVRACVRYATRNESRLIKR